MDNSQTTLQFPLQAPEIPQDAEVLRRNAASEENFTNRIAAAAAKRIGAAAKVGAAAKAATKAAAKVGAKKADRAGGYSITKAVSGVGGIGGVGGTKTSAGTRFGGFAGFGGFGAVGFGGAHPAQVPEKSTARSETLPDDTPEKETAGCIVQ